MMGSARLVHELERRRKERECLPNIRNKEGFQSLGDINMVTALGFELVRRNVRMIIERSPEYEPLIALEKTKIRTELANNKAKAELKSQGSYNYGYLGDTEVISQAS